jgi:hypothetical protein
MPSARRRRLADQPVPLPRFPRAHRQVRAGACALLLVAFAAALVSCRSPLARQYEYEEEVYLSLDGSATVYVNASIPALAALRGLDHDVSPRARLDRAAIRRAYDSPVSDVLRLSASRRHGRRFVHLRIAVSDIERLAEAAPFAWSTYALEKRDDEVVFRQQVGAPAGGDPGDPGWRGDELVAFRMHLPSKIRYHDAPSKQVERGNILAWEQPLAERLAGEPVSMEVRLDTQSILYRTLWLFGSMIVVVLLLFAGVIWWIMRSGRERESAAPDRAAPR